MHQANLAQLVERHLRNVQVVGSIPIVGSLHFVIVNDCPFYKKACIDVQRLEPKDFYPGKLRPLIL